MFAVEGVYTGERTVMLNRAAPVDEGYKVIVTFVRPSKKNTEDTIHASDEEKDLAERQAAYQHLLTMIGSKKKSLPEDFNYKDEWHKHLDEKYGNFD
ncbi:MAG: hypothetical protein LBV52_06005 [Spirochaetaceae bacterium]|jgi:hypothetical protein|nr:hypothetical protein [Spirochaetaceae bacterium]